MCVPRIPRRQRLVEAGVRRQVAVQVPEQVPAKHR